MRTRFYTAVAYGTLVADAYLALASVATKAMPREGHHYLPPFGWVGVSEVSRILVLFVATWTAILALGCLAASSGPRESPHGGAILWFVLVLGVIWLLVLLPLLIDLLWGWFVWGS